MIFSALYDEEASSLKGRGGPRVLAAIIMIPFGMDEDFTFFPAKRQS